jgi:hypothetical protein
MILLIFFKGMAQAMIIASGGLAWIVAPIITGIVLPTGVRNVYAMLTGSWLCILAILLFRWKAFGLPKPTEDITALINDDEYPVDDDDNHNKEPRKLLQWGAFSEDERANEWNETENLLSQSDDMK